MDADAVTRALMGEGTIHYPGWRGDGVWPPLHFYLNAASTMLFGSRVIGSVFLNILLGSAIAFPVFALTRRWSTQVVAVSVTLVVLFNPLIFRNSLQGLSEIPFFFFAACAFYFIDLAITDTTEREGRLAFFAGLCITVASGIRYEAWLIIILLSVIIVVAGRWRSLHFFLPSALVFPVLWMFTNQMAQGNMFKGLEHVIHWQGTAQHATVPRSEIILRSAFFPISFLLAATPLALVLGVVGITSAFGGRRVFEHQGAWLLLFPVILLTMAHMARNAELLLQHRFTSTLVLAFIPYLTLGFSCLKRSRSALPTAFAVLILGSSTTMVNATCQRLRAGIFAPQWNEAVQHIQEATLDQLKPIPTLRNDLPDRVLQEMGALPQGPRLLVLEFFGWEETYNVAFRSNMIATSTVFLSDHGDAHGGMEFLNVYLGRIPGSDGVLVLRAQGPYSLALAPMPDGRQHFQLPDRTLVLTEFAMVDDLRLFTFSTKQEHVTRSDNIPNE